MTSKASPSVGFWIGSSDGQNDPFIGASNGRAAGMISAITRPFKDGAAWIKRKLKR